MTKTTDGTSDEPRSGDKQQQQKTTITPLFDSANNDDNNNDNNNDADANKPTIVSFADGFRDKVRVLFEYFDQDKDGYLNFEELKALQDATTTPTTTTEEEEDDNLDDQPPPSSSSSLTEQMYVMACKTLNCHPRNGLSLEALKFTYAADGSDIDKDFNMVFESDDVTPKIKPSIQNRSTSTKSAKKTKEKDSSMINEKSSNNSSTPDTTMSETEKVYEIGADGTVDISS